MVAAAAIAALALPSRGFGQRPDSAAAREPIRSLATVPPDSLNAPISARRAFFYSFLVPGSAQSILGRHKAAAAFMFVEAICIAMIRESGADVHEARRAANDTLIVSYVDAAGNPAVTTEPPRFGDAEIHTREAVFSACGESEATYLGEQAQKDTCKYVFKVAGHKEEDSFVQVYAPAQKDVPAAPNDPFFRWKKLGKVFVTDKALSPKSAPLLAASTGLWMPGKGYAVSINASTAVCTKPEAEKLAKSLH